MTRCLVLGAGGFIGTHLVEALKAEGAWVRGADLKEPRFSKSSADEFATGDLRDIDFCRRVIDQPFDEVYQLAADMGGAGYVFVGDHDAEILHNSALINLNVLEICRLIRPSRIFYASSACIYPQENQASPGNPLCREDTAYPANPDSDYGFEKLFSERLYMAYARNHRMKCRIGRYHNIFGPLGSWNDGREKAPAALCRKVAEAENGGTIEIWGDGLQTRTFLYVDECTVATRRLLRSEFESPVNIGSEELVSINGLVDMIADIAGKSISKRHIPGPQGVRGRSSDNRLIRQVLGWAPSSLLQDGLRRTYAWIEPLARRAPADDPSQS